MSGLAIAYPTSPLTVHDGDTTRTGPRPGQRLAQVRHADARDPSRQPVPATLRKLGWTLLVVAAPETAAGSLDAWQRKTWPAPTVHTVDGPAAVQLGLGATRPEPSGAPGSGPEATGWLPVRPDGYVAARGHGPAELDRALARIARATRWPRKTSPGHHPSSASTST